MVYTCCICKWRGDKKPARSFHKFPINETDKIKWLEIVAERNGRLSSRPVVCSSHFKENCFRYGAVEGRAFLKQGSLPTEHLIPDSAVISNNSVPSSSSTEIRRMSSADGIKFCDLSCSSSRPAIEEYLSSEITMETIVEVIEQPTNKEVCLDKPIECGSIKCIRGLYLQEKLKEKMKKILSLKRQIKRLHINKLKMKAKMQQLQKKHKVEKRLMYGLICTQYRQFCLRKKNCSCSGSKIKI